MSRAGALSWWGKELPKHVLYLYSNGIYDEWHEYTRADLIAKKKAKQESNISEKRYCHRRVPCYIHVFKNNSFLFNGFFIVIWSAHGMWYLNWKTAYKHEGFLERIKQHLPLGLLPSVDDYMWFNEFCKAYPMKPKGTQKPRGKKLIHCILDSYNNLIDIDLGGAL
jgi:hypothetical protein